MLGLASPPVAASADERTYASQPGIFFPSPRRVDRRIPGLPHHVSINDLGFRGPQVPLKKPQGEFRIAMIGDSFTWGDYVDDEETLPAQLEAVLRTSCPSVRVLNLGVGGTTIDGQVAMLERAAVLAPDAIVLVGHDNDVLDMRAPTYWTSLATNRARKSQFPASLIYAALRNTALWTVVRQANARLQAPAPMIPRTEGLSDGPPSDLDTLKVLYHQGLRAFADRVRASGTPLLVTAYPSHIALRNPEKTPFAWFEDIVRADSLTYVSAREALLESKLSVDDLYLLPLDGHASARGYRVVAEALARATLQSVAIAGCTPSAS